MRGRVLIVDDERFFRDLYQEVLEAQGHVVVPVASAEEAMREVQGQHFDLILTDLVMPGTDGLDLVKQMRARDPGPSWWPSPAATSAWRWRRPHTTTTMRRSGMPNAPSTWSLPSKRPFAFR